MGTESVDVKDAESALAAFVDARQAAQVALEQCEVLAESTDDLRTSARSSAQAIQRCEELLEAISRIGPGLQEPLGELDKGVAAAALALRDVATSTQDLEERLTKSLHARVAEQLSGTAAALQSDARAAVDEAANRLQGELAENAGELRSAQQALHSALDRAVATVEKRIKPPTPIRVQVGGWGFIVAFLSALLTGAGLVALLARADGPYAFEVLEDRLVAVAVVAGLGALGVVACILLLVSLLRRETRWWLSVAGLLLAVAATAAAVVTGIQIMVS